MVARTWLRRMGSALLGMVLVVLLGASYSYAATGWLPGDPGDAATSVIDRTSVSSGTFSAQTATITHEAGTPWVINSVTWDGVYEDANYELLIGGESQGSQAGTNDEPITWADVDVEVLTPGVAVSVQRLNTTSVRYGYGNFPPPRVSGGLSHGAWQQASGSAMVPLSITYTPMIQDPATGGVPTDGTVTVAGPVSLDDDQFAALLWLGGAVLMVSVVSLVGSWSR